MTDTEPIAYAAAIAELDEILGDLERDEVDVDHLAERVRRAGELVRICRDRIRASKFEVEQIVAEFDDD